MAITPLAATRVSDLLVRQRLFSQVQADQLALLRLQEQISSGRRLLMPSDDAPAALRAVTLQRIVEQKTQVRSNIDVNLGFLGAADLALGQVSQLVNDSRSAALGVVGTLATDAQREAVALQIERAIQQLAEIGNQQFRGRYLFAGTALAAAPFARTATAVEYRGNQGQLLSYSDLDLLFPTNLPGSDVFGALSTAVAGTADLNPIVTERTRLADLRLGGGITPGSIVLSDGVTSTTVDLSRAETLGDVAVLLRNNPPPGRAVTVSFSSHGLVLELEGGGLLSVRDVSGGTTALQLGIRSEAGGNPVIGTDLNPRLTRSTRLADAFGTRAAASLVGPGDHDDLVIEAVQRGPDLNGVQVQLVGGGTAGAETAVFAAGVLTVTIEDGVSTAGQVRDAINAQLAGQFTARLGPHDAGNRGDSPLLAGAAAAFSGGSGAEFDQASGLRVTVGQDTHVISLATAQTIEDLLNIVNGSNTGVLAELNAAGTGLDFRCRVSGVDFAIGENGGSTASQLGVRSFTLDTRLADLNHGRGVATRDGADLAITRTDGVVLEIDLDGATTIGQVIDRIHAASLLAGGVQVTARLAAYGNGLELVADDAAPLAALAVNTVPGSRAAIDLGLVPEGGSQSAPAAIAGSLATLTGRDVNPQEVSGLFTALVRLRDALRANDQGELARSIATLDQANVDLNFSRAEFGARQQALDTVKIRLEDENISLQRILSAEVDVDLAEAISQLTNRQVAFEAALRVAANVLQTTLLNFL